MQFGVENAAARRWRPHVLNLEKREKKLPSIAKSAQFMEHNPHEHVQLCGEVFFAPWW